MEDWAELGHDLYVARNAWYAAMNDKEYMQATIQALEIEELSTKILKATVALLKEQHGTPTHRT